MSTVLSDEERREFFSHLRDISKQGLSSSSLLNFYKLLYFVMTNKGEYIEEMFPLYTGKIPTTFEECLEESSDETVFFDYEKEKINHSHKGRCCSKKIPVGQPIYNCYDCAVDGTCCLCDDCFDKEQHGDHNVLTHFSSGNGICDCGDELSWKVDIHCLADTEANRSELEKPLPEGFQRSIESVVNICLDLIIDFYYMNSFITDSFHDRISKPKSPFETSEQRLEEYAERFSSMLGSHSKFKDYYNCEPSGKYVLLIWNDEIHDIYGAKRAIGDALLILGDLTGEALSSEDMTELVDQNGYAKMCVSSDVKTLCKAYDSIQSKGFYASIMDKRLYSFFFITEMVTRWITSILERTSDVRILEHFRKCLSDSLFSPASPLPVSDPNAKYPDFDFKKFSDLGFFTKDGLMPRFEGALLNSHQYFDELDSLPNLKFHFSRKVCDPNVGIENGSRIQYIFYLGPRFKKSLRTRLKSILVPVLSTSSKSRELLSDQILEILPSLEYMYLHYDKEWQLSFLDEFKLQIYYDPHIMTHLLDNGMIKIVLASLLEMIYSFSAQSVYKYKIIPSEMNEIYSKRRVDSLSSIIKGYTSLICQIKRGDTRIFNLNYFIYLLAIFNYFQESFMVKRKKGEHVEQSSITYTLHYTNAVQLEKIAASLGEAVSTLTEKCELLDNAIVLLVNFIEETEKQHYSVYDLDNWKFSIAENEVSYLLPLHSLLAHLLKNYKHFDYGLINQELQMAKISSNEVTSVAKPENSKDVLSLSCSPLNTFSLSAQIDSGFWVRNGEEIYHQFQYNLGNFNTMGNLLLCQLSFAFVDPNVSLNTIVERFGLKDQLFDNKPLSESIFDDHVYNVIDHLILFFYHTLTFREHFDRRISFDEFKCLELKHELCYKLLKEPKKYSQLAKIRQLYDLDDQFDAILGEVADYLPPKGGNDFGKYCLKKVWYTKLDYLSFFARFEPYDDLENFLSVNLKSKKSDDELPVILPIIPELSGEEALIFKKIFEIYKLPQFAKLLYRLLKYVDETENEDYLDHLLHLLHAVMLEPDSPGDYALKAYVDIPICNLLFGIIEKEDMNKRLVKKAQAVLDLLLLKDDAVMESLVECFGEKHIQEYKKTIKGSGFETKKEKSRRLALKRQQKILKKMNSQQKQFMQKNRSFFREEIEKEELGSTDYSSQSYHMDTSDQVRTCIICKNPENSEELFGVPGYVSSCSAFWEIPNDPVPIVMRDESLDSNLINETYKPKSNKRKLSDHYSSTPNPVPQTFSAHSSYSNGPPVNQFKRRVITGCSHGMHFSCLQKRVGASSLNMFECPLCKNYYNFFVPSFRFPSKSTTFMMEGESNSRLKTVLHNYSGDNSSALLATVFDKEIFHGMSDPNSDFFKTVSAQIVPILEGFMYALNGYSTVYYPNIISASRVPIARLLGDTIELYEIASRYDEEDRKEFSDVIGPISLELLRSLIQLEVMLYFMESKENLEFEYSIEKIFRNNSGFVADILPLFFAGGDSLQTLSRVMLSKYASKGIIALVDKDLKNSSNDALNLICEDPIVRDEKVPRELVDKLKIYIRNVHGALTSKYVDEVDKHWYNEEKVEKYYKIIKFLYYRAISSIELVQYVFNGLSNEFLIFNENQFRPGYSFNSYLLYLPTFDELLTNMRFSTNSLEYEIANSYSLGTSSTILDARDGNLPIEYPKKVSLLNLPEKISSFLSIFQLTKASEKKVLCLQCGELLEKDKSHRKSCIGHNDGFHILFSPYNNVVELAGESEYFGGLSGHPSRRVATTLESPYLNKHGELAGGYLGMGGSGILNKVRIDHINKKWLNQAIATNYFTVFCKSRLNSARPGGRQFPFTPGTTREEFRLFQNILGEMNRAGVNFDIGMTRNDGEDEDDDGDFDEDDEFNEVGGIPFSFDYDEMYDSDQDDIPGMGI